MTVVERLTPNSDIKSTLEGLSMPITAAIVFQILFIILNLIDGDDEMLVSLPDTVGFVIMAVLIAFWIGIVAIKDGGNIGDALVGSAVVGLIYGLLTSIFQELLGKTIFPADDDLFNGGYFGKMMILNILSWMVLFIMLGFVGAGLADDMASGDKKTAKAKPDKKATTKTAKKAKKKTTKKAKTSND